MVIFSFLKFAQNPRTCVAQLDCIKTKWKLSWQVIIKDSQNHWTNHFCAFNHNKINFMSQNLPWLNSLGFLHEPVCDRDNVSTYWMYTVLESRTVRTGGSTCSGGSCAVDSMTRELFVHPTCVQALSRNWWGVNAAKSVGRTRIYLLSYLLFRRFHLSSTFLYLRTVK